MKILIILSAIVAIAQCWPDFYLFTRNNSNLYHYTSGDLITAPEYTLNKQTIFVIHGYTVNSTAPNIVKVRDALLDYTDLNIIMVDWEKGAASSNFFNPTEYISAGFNGDRVAQDLVLFMKNNNIDPANTYCIGHSMGSHVCGFVGQRVTKKLARITGLDPAGPGFDLLDADHMLSKDDAQFVDTIHTSSLEGSNRPLGQVDFWPNGGQSKEACGLVNFSCEHHFAELLFAETVKGGSCKFTAVSCKSYLHFKLGMCSCKNSLCSSMGYYSDKSARGNYYLDTNANSPYCKK